MLFSIVTKNINVGVLTNMNIHFTRNINVSSENIQGSSFDFEEFCHPMIKLTQFL